MGKYHFTIFAKEETSCTDKFYSEICEYSLVCESVIKDVTKFPPVYSVVWGINSKFYQYDIGVCAEFKEIIQHTSKGTLELDFIIKKPLRFRAELMNDNWKEKELCKYVLTRQCDDTVIITAKPPSTGEFSLIVYVNDPLREGNELTQICQYLLVCDAVCNPHPVPFPVLPAGFLGPQPAYYNTPVKAMSTIDPYIILYKQHTTMTFTTDEKTAITWELLGFSENNQTEYNLYVFQMTKNNMITLLINFPITPYYYKFLIFSGDKPEKDDAEVRFKSIFNYLIDCRAIEENKEVHPFPTQLDTWGEGMELIEPYHIHSVGNVKFSLKIPEAEAVAVVIDSVNWNYLKNIRDNWTGIVKINSNEEVVTVCAKIKNISSKFIALLKYKSGKE